MTASRREFLAIGATGIISAVAAGGVAAQEAKAQADGAAARTVSADKRTRLVSFQDKGGGAVRAGVVTAGGRVVPLPAFASMLDIIKGGAAALEEARKAAGGSAGGSAGGLALADVRLMAPLPEIQRNIYAVGWNYLAHFEEGKASRLTNQELPEHPVFFSKGTHTLNGPFDAIPYDPAVSTMIDWECELAVIIGKRGRNIAEAAALDHVFGYTVINDTTARDLQQKKHGGQWFKGKSLDGHGPMGPWIVPAGEIDPGNVHLLLRVNGVVKQDASTQQMYFKVPRIISELSQGLTLEPGDIIATGTPPGIGYARKPPEFLKPGDVMESEIVEIGTIRNVIGA